LPIGPSADKLRVAREPGRLSGGPGVSSETRQYIEALLALSPWIAFVLAVAWFWVLDVRDNVRALRVYERASATTREASRPQADHDHVTRRGRRSPPRLTRVLALGHDVRLVTCHRP
jgi:hypothetical protein